MDQVYKKGGLGNLFQTKHQTDSGSSNFFNKSPRAFSDIDHAEATSSTFKKQKKNKNVPSISEPYTEAVKKHSKTGSPDEVVKYPMMSHLTNDELSSEKRDEISNPPEGKGKKKHNKKGKKPDDIQNDNEFPEKLHMSSNDNQDKAKQNDKQPEISQHVESKTKNNHKKRKRDNTLEGNQKKRALHQEGKANEELNPPIEDRMDEGNLTSRKALKKEKKATAQTEETNKKLNPPIKNKMDYPKKRKALKKEKKSNAETKEANAELNSTIQAEMTDEQMQDEKLRTIFVGNLPMTVTKKKLKVMFKKFGKIQSIRFRSAVPANIDLPKKVAVITKNYHPEKQSLNAYVVMKDLSSVKKSLELNGEVIEGKHIRIDLANSQAHDTKQTVFVGNLPLNTMEEDLWAFFEDCGKIEGIRIIRDSRTGLGKGIGYVLFGSVDAMNIALQRNDQEFQGRALRISRAQKIKAKKIKNTENGHRVDKKPVPGSNRQNANQRIEQKKWQLGQGAPAKYNYSFQGVKSSESKNERFKVERGLKTFKRKIQRQKN